MQWDFSHYESGKMGVLVKEPEQFLVDHFKVNSLRDKLRFAFDRKTAETQLKRPQKLRKTLHPKNMAHGDCF